MTDWLFYKNTKINYFVKMIFYAWYSILKKKTEFQMNEILYNKIFKNVSFPYNAYIPPAPPPWSSPS